MGRVRCVKPKADAVSIGKAAKKKVAKKSKVRGLRRSTVGSIKGRTRILAQYFHCHYATGVCWDLYSYGMYNGQTISYLERPFVEVEVDPDKILN
jgi:hypothetical protein